MNTFASVCFRWRIKENGRGSWIPRNGHAMMRRFIPSAPIGGFWFDGNWSKKDADWEEDALYSMIRSYHPDAILINNSGLSHRGRRGNPYLDTLTFEQSHVEDSGARDQGRHLAMKACQTINYHWGTARWIWITRVRGH